MKKIIAVTSCPAGIAHTYMAAEAIQIKAKEMGYDAKVETRGSVGVENELTAKDIEEAEAVIVAAETNVDTDRFAGKKLFQCPVAEAVHHTEDVIKNALAAPVFKSQGGQAQQNTEKTTERKGAYKHLMNGVSHMLPFVVAGGLAIAISFMFGFKAFDPADPSYNKLAEALMTIGGGSAFALMIPILAGFIAYSIADRPGLAPGMIGGMIAASIKSGFLGGIVAGFLAGYTVQFLKKSIKLPRTLEGIKPILILPLFGSLITGLLMIFVLGKPMTAIMTGLEGWLKGLGTGNAVVLGLVLGAMMAIDMGGPVNKAAYAFSVGLLTSNIFGPMAAVMAAGMVPPLAVALATVLAKDKFTEGEREAGKAAWVLGASFITEGAIPFAAADPARVIPSLVAGSALAGALSMAFGCQLRAPHGGIFVIPFITNIGGYVIAIAAGTVVAGLLISFLKKRTAA